MRPSAPPRPATDLPSLPPRVPGPVRYYVTVKCHKILWNSTGHSLLKRAAQTEERQAKVELRWWGEDEGILLNPLNVSLKSPSSPASPKTLKDRKTTVKYAVKCYKKQLATYLSDMGPLALPITLNDLTIGTASVGPFESIVNEPYRAHNAFYPIVQSPSSFMSPTSSSASIDESGGKPPKVIGELHFVMEMEDVTTATKAKEEKGTSTLKQNLKQITPSKNSSKFRVGYLKV